MSQYSKTDPTDLNNLLYCLEKGGIERQESHEQAKLVQNCDLPKECTNWSKLQEWGVIKSEETDPLFVSCILPEGWCKVPTDHSMWSNLVDGEGLIRASIFYKGAFYDRTAHMSVVVKRYCASNNHDIGDAEAYEVRDSAKQTTVKQFPASPWGYITASFINSAGLLEEKKIVGLIHRDTFHYNPKGEWDEARFTESCNAPLATQITYNDFYKDFHHVESCHDVIYAGRFLAKQEAVELANKMNVESGW